MAGPVFFSSLFTLNTHPGEGHSHSHTLGSSWKSQDQVSWEEREVKAERSLCPPPERLTLEEQKLRYELEILRHDASDFADDEEAQRGLRNTARSHSCETATSQPGCFCSKTIVFQKPQCLIKRATMSQLLPTTLRGRILGSGPATEINTWRATCVEFQDGAGHPTLKTLLWNDTLFMILDFCTILMFSK